MKIDDENMDFGAKFVDEKTPYSSLKQMPGIDGFELPVDPLYKVCNNNDQFKNINISLSPPHTHTLLYLPNFPVTPK